MFVVDCDEMGPLLARLREKHGAALEGRLCIDCGRVWFSLYDDDLSGRHELRERFAASGKCPRCATGHLHTTHAEAPYSGLAVLQPPDGEAGEKLPLLVSVCDQCGEAVAELLTVVQQRFAANIPGLRYVANAITAEQEQLLLAIIDQQAWQTELRRRVQHYGYQYDYERRSIDRSLYLGDLPTWLTDLSAEFVEHRWLPKLSDQVIINEYMPGQGIAPHVDCVPCFGEAIASLSLGSGCQMDFIRAESKEKHSLFLEPRSLLVLTGDARHRWRHSIPARKNDQVAGQSTPRGRRVSLTFRTVLLSDE
jgi:alkylated DNA repair dioxygenase AlkB